MAYYPDPPDGAVDAQAATKLTWLPGLLADQHHVYFGTSLEAVTARAPDVDKGVLAETTFDPCGLQSTTIHYWCVDEILVTGEIKAGPVWSFTTCLPAEDFESYNDDEGKGTRVYETWIDGYSDGSSGSTVGNIEPPFAEQTIVHGGKQSMPMDYNSVNTPFYSEAYREFSPVQDWTVGDVNLLTIWIRGQARNSPAPLYVTLQDASNHSTRVTCPDAAIVTATKWTRWQVPLSQFAGVNPAKVKRLYIGVGDRGAPAAGGAGRLYIDDIYLTKP